MLRIKPLRELEQLRVDPKQEREHHRKERYGLHAQGNRRRHDGAEDHLRRAQCPRSSGSTCCATETGTSGFTIASGKASKTLTVGYVNPPFELKEGEDLTLRVFIDKSMIEVFANDRQAAVAWHEYDPDDLHVSLFSKGGPVTVKKVEAWKMKSAYSGK